jgi:hypothetical protein
MKKIFYLLLIIFGISLTACERQSPIWDFSASKYILEVGDSAMFRIYNAQSVSYNYSDSRDNENPVFEITHFSGDSTIIYARNVGSDTLWVGCGWQEGIFNYGITSAVVVRVIEK